MRSCIYCGKTLEKGEVCDCVQSKRMRQNKSHQHTPKTNTSNTNNTSNSSDSYSSSSYSYSKNDANNSYTYKTGYTKKEKKRFLKGFFDKMKNNRTHSFNIDFKNMKSNILSFMTDPVNSVSNAKLLNKFEILIYIVIQALIMSISFFFVKTRLSNSVFKIFGDILGVNGIQGMYNIKNLLLSALFGTISISAIMLMLIGIYYLIGRFVFKQHDNYWDFSIRLVWASIPMSVLSAIGILLSFFSATGLILVVMAGFVLWIVLLYEALKTQWLFLSSGKVLYTMTIGIFIFFTILSRLMRF